VTVLDVASLAVRKKIPVGKEPEDGGGFSGRTVDRGLQRDL